MAIFPAVFTFGYEPSSGPSLLFITIPSIFASIPGGSIFVVLFFLLAAIAATGAMLSILEVPVAFLNESFQIPRSKATVAIVLLLALVGSTAALSNSAMADFKLFGKTMFDLFDFATSNILLPLGGLFLAIFVGWVWDRKTVFDELTNGGRLGSGSVRAYFFITRYVSPVLVLLILLRGLGII
jgi:NSS family neurotransmitter:Na+ symporter